MKRAALWWSLWCVLGLAAQSCVFQGDFAPTFTNGSGDVEPEPMSPAEQLRVYIQAERWYLVVSGIDERELFLGENPEFGLFFTVDFLDGGRFAFRGTTALVDGNLEDRSRVDGDWVIEGEGDSFRDYRVVLNFDTVPMPLMDLAPSGSLTLEVSPQLDEALDLRWIAGLGFGMTFFQASLSQSPDVSAESLRGRWVPRTLPGNAQQYRFFGEDGAAEVGTNAVQGFQSFGEGDYVVTQLADDTTVFYLLDLAIETERLMLGGRIERPRNGNETLRIQALRDFGANLDNFGEVIMGMDPNRPPMMAPTVVYTCEAECAFADPVEE